MTARSRHLTIAHVLWADPVGGIGRLVHDLAQAQARLGSRVTLVFDQAQGRFADAAREIGLPVIELGLRSGYDLRPRLLWTAAAQLSKYDVLHLHGFNPPLGAIVLGARRPTVFTAHGSDPLGRRRGAKTAIKRRLEGALLRLPSVQVVANSAHTSTRLYERHRLDPGRVEVIHNGLDFSDLGPPAPCARPNGRLRVAFVGRLVDFKRVDRLLRAAADARDRNRLQVLVVGSGPLESQLRSLALDLRVENQVRFLGYRKDVRAILESADVFVLPSQNEPFGLVLLEAAAKGLLPIAFADGGGALEAMSPNGLVVQDVAELAALFDKLPGSAALEEAARRARARVVRERFAIDRTAEAYLEIYDRIVTNAGELVAVGEGMFRRR